METINATWTNRRLIRVAGCVTMRFKGPGRAGSVIGQRRQRVVDLRASAAFDLGPARPVADSAIVASCPMRPAYTGGRRTNQIDTTYVENAADAHIRAADALSPGSAAAGKAYFISQGEPVNCWDWINKQLAMAGLPPVQRSVSFATAWKLGAFFEAVYRVLGWPGDPPMTRFCRPDGPIALVLHFQGKGRFRLLAGHFHR